MGSMSFSPFSCWTGDMLFQAEVLDIAQILVACNSESLKEYDGTCPDGVDISN